MRRLPILAPSHANLPSMFDPSGRASFFGEKMQTVQDRPCAAAGLKSYRYRGESGWIMIGAENHDDALRESLRSTQLGGDIARLEVWDRDHYVPAMSFAERHRRMALSLGRAWSSADRSVLYDFGDCARWELHWEDGAMMSMLETSDKDSTGREKALSELQRIGFKPSN